jgi:PAS domain-containing protein
MDNEIVCLRRQVEEFKAEIVRLQEEKDAYRQRSVPSHETETPVPTVVAQRQIDPQEREDRFRDLANNINVGIYRNTTGPEGRFIEANPAIVRMFGFDSKEAFFKSRVVDLYQNSDDRRKFNEKMKNKGS